MAEATKYVPIGDIKTNFSILKPRKKLIFAYSFMLLFLAFTLFLAFCPSSNSSSPSFTNIFTSTSSTYKSKFSSFFPFFFHNTTSSSSSPTSPPKTSRSTNHTSTKSVKDQKKTNQTSTFVPSSNQNLTSVEKHVMESLIKCDFFDGKWVKDDSYPLYKPGSCNIIDEQFSCINNGRPDKDYQKYKWKPKGCSLPRLDGDRMLELLRGKRVVFVGDSINRNMWESLICILRNAVKDKTKVYEANGRVHFRGEASYSFLFKDYNFTVELFVSPFLVQEWEIPVKNGTKKEKGAAKSQREQKGAAKSEALSLQLEDEVPDFPRGGEFSVMRSEVIMMSLGKKIARKRIGRTRKRGKMRSARLMILQVTGDRFLVMVSLENCHGV